MNGTHPSLRLGAPVSGPIAEDPAPLVRAWSAAAVSFVVVVLAAVWGPTPGDPTWWMVAEFVLVAIFGVGGALVAAWSAESARRHGRDLGLVVLFLAGFLLLQACLRLVGTLGRFYGWDA
jgi:hypothetical protein